MGSGPRQGRRVGRPGPGALARSAARKPLEKVDFIGVLAMPDGHRIYTRGTPNVQGLTGYEEGAIRGIQFERWMDDGSEEYKKAYDRVRREGSFVEANS